MEISKFTDVSNNPTVIKFVSVLVGITQMHDRVLSLRALAVWLEFLQQDEIMKRQFNPNPEFIASLNLILLLQKDGDQFDLKNPQTQAVMNFCCFIMEAYGAKVTSFFNDKQAQKDLKDYYQNWWGMVLKRSGNES